MKILLSAGIQLAQSDISVDQAKGLGLITYLSFLRIKSTQRFAQLQKSKNSSLVESAEFQYRSLCNVIDDFLQELKIEIEESNSVNAFLNITQSLENDEALNSNLYWGFERLLDRIYQEAQSFMGNREECFMNTISSLQSLAALENWKSKLTAQAFCPLHSQKEVLNFLNALQTSVPVAKRATTWQVA